MGEESNLDTLCIICFTDPPKYCCPGCGRRTCSLICYQTHKERSQCTGKRDPASYLKKSQLQTPQSLDHDFNFLTDLERTLDKAERSAKDHGVTLEPHDTRKQAQYLMTKRLRELDIEVHLAPTGMSRQKANKTHWMKRLECIAWTVEWIDAAGAKSIRHDVLETHSLAHAYASHLKQLKNSEKRKEAAQLSDQNTFLTKDKPSRSQKRRKVDSQVTTPDDTPDSRFPVTDPAIIPPSREPIVAELKPESVTHDGKARYGMNFYLLKAHTVGPSRVLRQVDPSVPISAVLHGQELLEFPTIVTIADDSDLLPQNYVIEAAYLKRANQKIQIVEDSQESSQKLTVDNGPNGKEHTQDENLVDHNELQRSLQKDIAALQHGQK